MERLVWHIVVAFSKTAPVFVIGPKGCNKTLPEKVPCSEIPIQPLLLFMAMAKIKALWQAMRFKPQVVFAGSGLTAPIAWIAARISGARAFAYVHGLDLAVSHPVYRTFWLPFLRRIDGVIANSRSTAALAEKAGVAKERIRIVHPGVALPQPDLAARTRFRAHYGLDDRPILLSVGRLTRRKGLIAFVKNVLPRVIREKPDACLLIVGDIPKKALTAQAEQPESILAAAHTIGIVYNIKWIGPVPEKSLDSAYFAADIFVFPVQAIPNDPEGFGMVAVEAAAHGIPTVAYATGGIVDAVADGVSGKLVTPGDADAFAAAILDLLDDPLDERQIRQFAERFTWPNFGHSLIQAILEKP